MNDKSIGYSMSNSRSLACGTTALDGCKNIKGSCRINHLKRVKNGLTVLKFGKIFIQGLGINYDLSLMSFAGFDHLDSSRSHFSSTDANCSSKLIQSSILSIRKFCISRLGFLENIQEILHLVRDQLRINRIEPRSYSDKFLVLRGLDGLRHTSKCSIFLDGNPRSLVVIFLDREIDIFQKHIIQASHDFFVRWVGHVEGSISRHNSKPTQRLIDMTGIIVIHKIFSRRCLAGARSFCERVKVCFGCNQLIIKLRYQILSSVEGCRARRKASPQTPENRIYRAPEHRHAIQIP